MFKKALFLFIMVTAFSIMADSMFSFDPNDLIDLYTTGQSSDYAPAQANSRLVNPGDVSKVAATYTDHPTRGSRWTGNDAYYTDWLAGLGEGEGIRSFNIWITTADYLGSYGNPYSRIDSQQDLFCGTNSPTIWLGGTAAGDWEARVVTVWDDPTYGKSYGVQWYTTNSASYLRPGGVDLGQFSFTMTDVWTGSDPNNPEQIVEGQQYRMFFGSSRPIFDDQGWGASSGLPAFSSTTNDSHFASWQGDMVVTAQAIPEPSTALLSGLAGVAILVRQRLRSRA